MQHLLAVRDNMIICISSLTALVISTTQEFVRTNKVSSSVNVLQMEQDYLPGPPTKQRYSHNETNCVINITQVSGIVTHFWIQPIINSTYQECLIY